jgi:Tfp pilus assembly protein PilV
MRALVILSAIVAVVVAITMSNPSSNPAAAQTTANLSLEQKLASIDANRIVNTDTSAVNRFHYLLKSLHDATGVDQSVIADKAAFGKHELHERYGNEVSALEFMEAMNTVVHKTESIGFHGEKNLSDVVTLLVVMTGKSGRP